MKRNLFIFSFSLLCIASSYAQTFRPDESDLKKFYFKITDPDKKEVEIYSDRNITGHIVMPEKITYKEVTYNVTSVAANGFHQAEMASITIPNSIKAIGKSAFHQCYSLTEITIPDGIEKIEEETFRHCTSLTKVVLPNSIQSIGRNAFYSCGKLESIELPINLNYLGDRVFNFCSKLKTVSIPTTVTTIPEAAFASCSNLESIELHEEITSIGIRAFASCRKLKNITLGKSITSIGSKAFDYCQGLTTVTLPNSLTIIEDGTFSDCTNLKEVIFGNEVTTIGNEAFKGCKVLNEIDLPITLTSLGTGAFENCALMASIAIPEGISEIAQKTFMNCTKLAKIFLPNGIVSLGDNCFNGCNPLDSITIPASVTSIGDSAFVNCIKLNDLYSEAKIAPALGTNVFEGTTEDLIIHVYYNASGYTTENGWTATISYDIDGVFQDENLTYIVTNYADKKVSVKANDELIEDAIVIPQTVVFEEESYTVTQVEVNAFKNCDKITSLTIPASVTSIGDNAFAGCTNLMEIYAKRVEAPELGMDVFDGLEEITTVYVKFNATGYTVENGWIIPVIYEKEGTSIHDIYDTLNVYVINNTLFIESEIEEYIHIYSIYGHTYSFKLNIGVNNFSLPKGIYIVNGKKVIV